MVAFNTNYTYSSSYVHTETGWENVKANDYATSTIRQYINGNTVLKHPDWEALMAGSEDDYAGSDKYEVSNMFDDFMIDITTDEVYALILGRSLSDLYKGANQDGTDVEFPTFASNAISSTEVDKFWIPSYTEIQNMLCGGTWDNSLAVWDTTNITFYWLRSPVSSSSSVAHYVGDNGDCYGNVVGDSGSAARAAFKLAI